MWTSVLCVLVFLFPVSAYAQSSTGGTGEDVARYIDAFQRPSNPIEADIAARIKVDISTLQDAQSSRETVDATFGVLGVNSVRLTDEGVLLVDVSRVGPVGEGDLPDLHDAIAGSLRDTRPFNASAPPSVLLFIDGRPAYEALCKDRESYAKDNTRPRVGQDVLVINAAHGVYRHHPRGSQPIWIAQRGRHNGIVEDLLTPVFAHYLKTYVSVVQPSAQSRVHLIRQSFTPPHGESGRAWIDLAGLYALQRMLPGRADVWGFSCRNPDEILNEPLREKYYDTSSRSRYANAIGADGIIHLHTNADCRRAKRGESRAKTNGSCPRGQVVNEAATGMSIFYAPTSTVSKTLSDLIACTAKQRLAAHYPSYRVSKPAPRHDLAELFVARKASVIVEVGFHTNPSDAALMTSEAFQKRSMEAVAEAWRKYVNQESCT